MASYVHGLLPMQWEDESTTKEDDRTIVETEDNAVVNNDCGYLGVGRPGSVPFNVQQTGRVWPSIAGRLCAVENGIVGVL